MEKLLTIIVPAYNAQGCLRHCLDSFLVPEILPQLEVLVINDGSTDETEAMAASYAEKYPDSFRLISKENGGHGSGINVGAAQAKGRYLKVIDADDWVISENLPAFFGALSHAQADVVLTNFHEVDMTTGEQEAWRMNLPEEFYGRELAFAAFMNQLPCLERVLQFHGISYKTSFYQSLQYHLTEHVFYEDQEYASVPFCRAETILPLDLFIYEYLVGNAQQSVSDDNRVRRLWMLEKVIDRLLLFQKGSAFQALPEPQKRYLSWKTEGLIIDHYMISCILNQDHRQGRKAAKAFHNKIKAIAPQLLKGTDKKYLIFRLANALCLSPAAYNALLHSRLYQRFR